MKKNVIYMIAVTVLLMLVIAGCSKTSQNQSEEAEEPVSLVYWTMWGRSSETGKAIREIADDYESETGVKVQVVYKGEEFVRDGYMAAIDKGTVIDLVDYEISYMNTTWEEYLLELDSYVEESGYEERARTSLISLARAAGEGNIRTIPYRPVVYAFYYNKDLFEEAGIRTAPQTWDEFVAVCEKLTEAGITPLTTDDDYALLLLGHHMARYAGEEEVRNIVGHADWDHDALKLAVSDYEKLAETGAFSKYVEQNIYPSGQVAELAGGEAAMYLGHSAMPEELVSTTGEAFNWGSFAYPEPAGSINGTETVQYTSKGIGISKNSEYPQEAFDFIQFMTQGEQDARFSELAQIIPADPSNTEWPERLEHTREVFEQIENGLTWGAGIESNSNVTDRLRENFLKVCAGNMSADEFIEAMKTVQ